MNRPPGNRTSNKVTSTDVHVGARVQLRRSVVGISRVDLARSTGVPLDMLTAMEEGKAHIGVDDLFVLAEALNSDFDWFFEGLKTTLSPDSE